MVEPEQKKAEEKFEDFLSVFAELARQIEGLSKNLEANTKAAEELTEMLDELGDMTANGILPAAKDVAETMEVLRGAINNAGNPLSNVLGIGTELLGKGRRKG